MRTLALTHRVLGLILVKGGIIGRMSTSRRFVVLNVASLIGVFASLFIVPKSTPFWTWAAVSALAFVLMNGALLARSRKAKDQGEIKELS
jgi:hypothetical protein